MLRTLAIAAAMYVLDHKGSGRQLCAPRQPVCFDMDHDRRPK